MVLILKPIVNQLKINLINFLTICIENHFAAIPDGYAFWMKQLVFNWFWSLVYS